MFLACCDGTLGSVSLDWEDRACVAVVMASGGYPGSYEKGKPIEGIEQAEQDPDVVVFQAGTKMDGDRLVTNGGRVLDVTATGPDIPAAIKKAYEAVGRIDFEGAQFRTDIGAKALGRLEE